mmetsp:Transcript_16946/g.42533  ORF Transcript_16946/g.42533 Transcript_16946/m.42533 type:complete len:349 (+) Transcript_16946:703-1749(+)
MHLAAVFVRHQEVPSADAASNIQNTLPRLQIQLRDELLSGVEAASGHKPFSKDALVAQDAVAAVLGGVQEVAERRLRLHVRHHLGQLPAQLVLVVLELHVRVQRLAELQLEARYPAVRHGGFRAVEQRKVVLRLPVLGGVLLPLAVPRLLEAALPEEEGALLAQPQQDVGRQCLDLLIGQVHEEPVREHDVKGVLGVLSLGGVRALHRNVLVLRVRHLVGVCEPLDEVHRMHRLGCPCEVSGESANARTELEHALLLHRAQQLEHLWPFELVNRFRVAVQHHVVHGGVFRVLYPKILHVLPNGDVRVRHAAISPGGGCVGSDQSPRAKNAALVATALRNGGAAAPTSG